MAKMTREIASMLAEAMVKNPTKVFELIRDGRFRVEVEEGKIATLCKFKVKSGETVDTEVLWENSVEALQRHNTKLQYKTHLSKYLYQTLIPILHELNSKGLTGNKKIDAILNSNKYQNYLQNERIELTEYTNQEDVINISTDGTSLARHKRLPFYTKGELLTLHEKARQLALADERAKIKRPYKYKKYIEEQYEEYADAMNKYNQDFNQLRELWNWKIEGDGIRKGYTNDDIYNKIILPVEFRLQSLNYNNKNEIREVNRMVRDLERVINTAESVDEHLVSYQVNL